MELLEALPMGQIRRRVPAYSISLMLRPNEFPTATQFVAPDLTPTVTPSGSPTVSQTAKLTVVSAETDPHLDSDYGIEVD